MSTLINEITNRTLKLVKRKLTEGAEISFPKTVKSRINQIYRAVHKAGLSKLYHDDAWAATDDYDAVITSLGYDVEWSVKDGGYGDYDETDHMPRSKTYNIRISCGEGRDIDGYVKMMAAGSVEDPFDAYDTCMVLWPAPKEEEY